MLGKTCTKCGVHHPDPASAFPRQKRSKDGLGTCCLSCGRIYGAEHRKNKDAIRAATLARKERQAAEQAAGVKTCPRCRITRAVGAFVLNRNTWDGRAAWCTSCVRDRENTPEVKAYRREWMKRRYWNNRESIRAFYRAYRSQHIDHAIALEINARARAFGVEGDITARDLRVLYAVSGGRCFYCDKRFDGDRTTDHIHPLALGGVNWPWNLVIACRSCNSGKRDHLPLDWAAERWRACAGEAAIA